MDWSFESGNPLAAKADALIVPLTVEDSEPTGKTIAAIDRALDGHLLPLLAGARFSGKPASTVVAPTLGKLSAGQLVLVGLGTADGVSDAGTSRAYGAAALAARKAGAATFAVALPAGASTAANVTNAVLGSSLVLYTFTKHRGTATPEDSLDPKVASIAVVDPDLSATSARKAIAKGTAIADAVALARDLGNEPGNVLNPVTMAEISVTVAKQAGIEVEVLDEVALDKLGAHSMLGVGKGSATKPRLIRLRYRPAKAASNRVIGLVGKCITFDTGGYSLKPHDAILNMKSDMSGGAAVLGVFSALKALDCPVAVEGTICAAENMISGEAFRPDDILTASNGVTIEILSTDAEGRLVLADGLVDTARRGATEMIDLATLTGAAVVALGEVTTALFSNNDDLADHLLAASKEAGEDMWRMPLTAALEEKIKGDVGDLKNVGGRAGGAITAALFLQHFSEGLPWAHLDIAGPSRFEKPGPEGPKGASGVGVRTLLDYLDAMRG